MSSIEVGIFFFYLYKRNVKEKGKIKANNSDVNKQCPKWIPGRFFSGLDQNVEGQHNCVNTFLNLHHIGFTTWTWESYFSQQWGLLLRLADVPRRGRARCSDRPSSLSPLSHSRAAFFLTTMPTLFLTASPFLFPSAITIAPFTQSFTTTPISLSLPNTSSALTLRKTNQTIYIIKSKT